MQTILGANGQIAIELARELHRKYTTDIRLVSRNPKKVNDTDQLFKANLLDPEATTEAVKGSDIVFLTVGVPADTQMWKEQFPVFMENTINACTMHHAKLVFFDNTYMYPQNSIPLTEESEFSPVGEKGKVRASVANSLLHAMALKKIEAVICRAPEFYGPDKTVSFTNRMIFDNLAKGKRLKVPLRDDRLRTLIWSPDASRATALIGNTPDAYNQTWHLPCDDNRMSYRQIIALISEMTGKTVHYDILRKYKFKMAGWFNAGFKELQELMPRYEHDNLFVSDKFKKRFPEFPVTTYKEGIKILLSQQN